MTTETPAENAETKQNNKKRKKTKLEKWFAFLHRAQRVASWGLFPVKKYGHTEPFNDRSYIIVANHLSVLDVLPAAIATDRPVHFLAKKSFLKKGLANGSRINASVSPSVATVPTSARLCRQ